MDCQFDDLLGRFCYKNQCNTIIATGPNPSHPAGDSRKLPLRVDFDRRLKLEFLGSKITSDAGLLAYRELDDVLGLTDLAGAALSDLRRGKNTRHLLTGLLRQSVFGRLAGYELIVVFDVASFQHLSWTHSVLVFLLEIIGLIGLAKGLGVNAVVVLLERIYSRIGLTRPR